MASTRLDAPAIEAGAGWRARVWIDARHFFSRADAQAFAWLWLLDADGAVHAMRLDAAWHGRDDLLGRLLQHLRDDPTTPLRDAALPGQAWPLPLAPVVPLPRWAVSWGHPVQQAIRAFASQLDEAVLDALGQLEVPGPFFGTVANYNRLACLPGLTRARRLQALALFPPLVAPLLLDVCQRADMFGHDEDEPAQRAALDGAPSAPVLLAMDRGRDLIGALAAEYRVDRALLRGPLLREPWVGGFAPRRLLRLLRAMPAHARPRTRESLQRWSPLLDALPVRWEAPADVERMAGLFAAGWEHTWRQVEAEGSPLRHHLADTRDFLDAVLAQEPAPAALPWLDRDGLALAWLARRGLRGLLRDSRRWHAQPLQRRAGDDSRPQHLSPLLDAVARDGVSVVELTTPQALIDEGQAMHHCIGGYWDMCAGDPARAVHLALADGQAATALYAWDGDDDTAAFELDALRGPCNRDVSAAMEALAVEVEAWINADERRERRLQVVREARQARAAHRSLAPSTWRPLDRRGREALHQVLAYAARQKDWQPPAASLYQGVVAGFAHAEGPRLLPRLAVGDALQLVREPGNAHDPLAVRIDWRGHKLGYVPRAGNAVVARALDRGAALHAVIDDVDEAHAWTPVTCVVTSAPGPADVVLSPCATPRL